MAFEHTLRVRFQHTDPAGIVFFANIFVFCHEAYEELMRAGGLPHEQLIRTQILPLAHAEADFRKPIRAGQLVRISIVVERIGERSFTLVHALHDESSALFATAKTVHVAVEPATGKSTPLLPAVRELLSRA